MQPNQPSITAENNAALRALESMRPAQERICNDPYAKYFVSNALRHTENLYSALFEQISGWDKVFPGVCDAILARAHFVDDCLNNAIQAGLSTLSLSCSR